jgi:hypothetical protein
VKSRGDTRAHGVGGRSVRVLARGAAAAAVAAQGLDAEADDGDLSVDGGDVLFDCWGRRGGAWLGSLGEEMGETGVGVVVVVSIGL